MKYFFKNGVTFFLVFLMLATMVVSTPQTAEAASWTYPMTDITGLESFNNPTGIAVDATGNIYVADTGNNKIKKMSSDGTWSDISGTGGFNAPQGIAVDNAGTVYVTDTGNNKIKKLPSGGSWTDITGGWSFNSPQGIAVDSSKNLYVVDYGNNAIVKLPNGGSWANINYSYAFINPRGILVDASNNVCLLSELSGYTGVKYFQIGSDAHGPTWFWISSVDNGNKVMANDCFNHKYTLNTTLNTIIRSDYPNGEPASFDLTGISTPQGIAADNFGNLYVTDGTSGKIFKLAIIGHFSVNYNANGSTEATVPTDSNTYLKGDTATVSNDTSLVKWRGYLFSGWNTAANGSGTGYAPGDRDRKSVV